MADSKISDLAAITSLADSDEMVVASSGASKKITGANLAASVATLASDGWIDASAETWTYVSATSFKVSGVDVTAKYGRGTRIKLTQSAAVKYFFVTSSSFSTDTTVNITGGNDFSLANTTISGNAYSYAASPQGYPTWFSFTPGSTGFSSLTTDAGLMAATGSMLTVQFNTQGTSNATTYTWSLPLSVNTSQANTASPCFIQNNGNSAEGRWVLSKGSTTVTMGAQISASGGFTASGTKSGSGLIVYVF